MLTRHDRNDEQLPNGSMIHWALQKNGKVPVSCGLCGKKRRLFAQNVTAAAFTGLCRSCAYAALRKHTDVETLSNGSVIYWNERRDLGREQEIPVQCGICGQVRKVPAHRIPTQNFTGYCADCARTGDRSHFWKTGRFKHLNGYILVRLTPDHPFYCMADSHHLVSEHRLVVAEHIGRPLQQAEIVHHKNGIKDDNRIENLELLARRLHHHGFEPPDSDTPETRVWIEILRLIDILIHRR